MGVSAPSLHRESTDSLIHVCHVGMHIEVYTYNVRVLKTFLKNVGMAVPETTETRCRDVSVQARHAIQRLHK